MMKFTQIYVWMIWALLIELMFSPHPQVSSSPSCKFPRLFCEQIDDHPGAAELPLTPRAVVWAKSGVLQLSDFAVLNAGGLLSIWWFSMFGDWNKSNRYTPVDMESILTQPLSKCFAGEYVQLDQRWNMIHDILKHDVDLQIPLECYCKHVSPSHALFSPVPSFCSAYLGTRHCQHFFRPWSGIRKLHEKTKLTSWPSSSINAWKHPLDLHPSFGKKNTEIHVTRDRFLGSPCAISSRCRPLARRSMKARFQVWRFQKRGISSTTWQFCKKNMFSWFFMFFCIFSCIIYIRSSMFH